MSVALLGLLVALLPAPAGSADDIDYADRWKHGRDFASFLEQADSREEEWHGNYEAGTVSPELSARVAAAGGRWRLLVIAEDWCGDSVNTVPYLARLVEAAPSLEMVIAGRSVGLDMMEARRTPDGRAATPTIVLLDAEFHDAGCWVERPATLQQWFLENEGKLPRDELYAKKCEWYARDRGQEALGEIVERIEAAAAGRPICSASDTP